MHSRRFKYQPFCSIPSNEILRQQHLFSISELEIRVKYLLTVATTHPCAKKDQGVSSISEPPDTNRHSTHYCLQTFLPLAGEDVDMLDLSEVADAAINAVLRLCKIAPIRCSCCPHAQRRSTVGPYTEGGAVYKASSSHRRYE